MISLLFIIALSLFGKKPLEIFEKLLSLAL